MANYMNEYFYKLDFACNNSTFGLITSAECDYNGSVQSAKLRMPLVNNSQRCLRRPINKLVSMVDSLMKILMSRLVVVLGVSGDSEAIPGY